MDNITEDVYVKQETLLPEGNEAGSIGTTSIDAPDFVMLQSILMEASKGVTEGTDNEYKSIMGIQNASPYSLNRKFFWKMDGFVPLAPDTEDSGNAMDLPMSIFTFGGSTALPEDGVYFINTHLITTTVGDEPVLELYCVDHIQPLDSARTLDTANASGWLVSNNLYN
ncbi:uncharacterized protein HD556DRAFT_1438913 [Suillus plorans]|uniref:Uncharacterized protein n=1 Tax=Suillus plorans TaxID=116603 RepID=A0A9P7DQZ6_9AGAM|nr:uncharacterized protein HD556DRAFT_1438913 [Suillus plorans]KAG1800912.1 hypothetical protein HD556DRAFT_1438913 [Suillus plorans]